MAQPGAGPIPGWGQPWAFDPARWPDTVQRTYRAESLPMAQWTAAADAGYLQRVGFAVTASSWEAPAWRREDYLVGCLLFFVIGLVIIIVALLVKPKGTLTVTYTRVPPPPASPAYQVFPVVAAVPGGSGPTPPLPPHLARPSA